MTASRPDGAGTPAVLRHGVAALSALAALPLWLAAAAFSPRWRVGVGERLGLGARAEGRPLWVHASSVGEILAASRLVDALLAKGHDVVASTSTATGREVMRRARPNVPCRLAPVDHPWTTELALSRVEPSALVLIETELWPCWIAAAARRGVPVVVVSARLSDRSFPRYRRIEPLLRRTLQRLARVGARTERDRERFLALGALPDRVTVSGDLKLEAGAGPLALAPDLERALREPPLLETGSTQPSEPPLLEAGSTQPSELPLLVAGSTHPGEETAALEALSAVEAAGHAAALVIAPRHLERVDEVLRAVGASGRAFQRRSALSGRALGAGEVLVLDSLGELASLYPRARACFVGGTLVPVGGHNLLEPLSSRLPVVFGPYTTNVRHAVEILEGCGAGLRVADATGLAEQWVALLSDPDAARARGEAGWQELQRHRGSAERAAQLVVAALGGQ